MTVGVVFALVERVALDERVERGHMSDESRSGRIGTRQVLLVVVVTVLAVAGSLLALRITPRQPLEPAAETARDASSAHSPPGNASPAVPGKPTSPPRSTSAPNDSGNPDNSNDSDGSGDRVADRAYEVASWLDIPRRAMRAYASATGTLQKQRPECDLSWVTLAAVGKIASDHGRHGGRELDDQGVPDRAIGTIEERDFAGDNISQPGAAGPLQLGQAAWQQWATSDSDDKPNVQDIDDAALTAGYALCGDDRDLGTQDDWISGLSLFNDAPRYIHRVVATASVYGTVGQRRHAPDEPALQAVTYAISKIGLPYVWGGDGSEAGDEGFDCSGLTKAAYGVADIGIPRTAHAQYTAASAVSGDDKPELGDLIFYGNPEHIHHVGIYIGNNQMVDAPTFGQAVQVHRYHTAGDDFVRAGRPSGR